MVIEGGASEKVWVKELKTELRENYVGYFGATTVHGLRYLTEQRRPWPEKVLWVIGVSVALVACIWLMHKTTVRWKESPVIVAMDESHRTVWQIPFPAVTVCPQAKTKTEFFNYTHYADRHRKRNLSQHETELLSKAQIPCRIPIILKEERITDRNGTDEIVKNSLSFRDVFENTDMKPFKPDPEFKRILTKEGMCFSFNMMPAKHMFREGTYHATSHNYLQYMDVKVQWDPTEGYDQDIDIRQAYPRPALGVGEEAGLSVALKTKFKYLHSMCNQLGHGFQVLLHSPIEFPQLLHETVFVPLDSFTQIFLTPHEIRTSPELRAAYSPAQRQCYFHDERRLRFFKFYTQKNCELECLANVTLDRCSCVEFYMPRMPDTPVCGRLDDEFCVKKVAASLYLSAAPQMMRQLPCDCLQSCAHIRYSSHHIQSQIDDRTADALLHSLENLRDEATNRSHVYIYYRDSLFIPVRRVEVFGTSDLLASLGGLMGLCMGVSLLSVIELFYWVLIRPCCQRIKQSNPQLRSVRKKLGAQKAEAAVQYSRYLEDEATRKSSAPAAPAPARAATQDLAL